MMFNNQFALSIPYWEENSNEGINKEIKQITNLLIEKGFIGYDPQTEKFITKKYKFNDSFKTSKTIIDKTVKNENTSKLNFGYIGIIIAITIIITVIVKKVIK